MSTICKASAYGQQGAKSLLPNQSATPRYRRSTTTRAPRKRTFVANMEKYLVHSSTPLGNSLTTRGLAAEYDVCCADGGNNNGANGGSNGGRGGDGGMGGNNSPQDCNDDGITAICAMLAISLVAMLQRIPFNADALSIKASQGAWASVTLCSN